jgi:meso-butanediol dehydrogenase / (S,S)-butanediol dehydrogenase / diacetyl reductase
MAGETGRRMPEFVLISGGAGATGSATARRFIAEGSKVALTDIDAERLKAVADELGALALPADGTQRDPLAEVVERTVSEFGALDTVIATQGSFATGPTGRRGDKQWFAALDINLNGCYFLATEALPHLIERKGSIVVLSSVAGLFGGPEGAIGYSAAKAGVINFIRYLARNHGPDGLRANAVCPGWIKTPLADASIQWLAEQKGITAEQAFDVCTAHTPLRRAADPSEIAAVCAFLASSDASMVTGHALCADGGSTAVDAGTIAFDRPTPA